MANYEDIELEAEAEQLAQKETWVLQTAQAVHEELGIELDTCEEAARWASLWMDDYKILVENNPPRSLKDAKKLADAAFGTSLERCEGVSTYPGGAPSLRTTMAAIEAFCLGHGPDAVLAHQMLEQE